MADDEDSSPKARKGRNTMRGYGKSVEASDLPPEQGRFEDEPGPVAQAQGAPPAPKDERRGRQPAVDIDLIHERRTAPLPDQKWVFVEIWTRNTIYALDSRLVCIDVVDQHTRRSIQEHALLGARLVGGQRRDGEAMELSHPFPRPGSEAVFEQSKGRQVRFSQTSSVTRVVLRLRVLTVASDHLLPAGDEITGQHGIKVT